MTTTDEEFLELIKRIKTRDAFFDGVVLGSLVIFAGLIAIMFFFYEPRNCSGFIFQSWAQKAYDSDPEKWKKLDGDGDKKVCE